MKVLFVWTGVTSYMADCWRALSSVPDVELKVVIEPVAAGRELDAAAVLRGIDFTLVPAERRSETAALVAAFAPDVLFAVGWHSPVVRAAVAALPSVPKVCCFDMPWRNSLRCVAARFVLHRYLRRFRAAYVPGRAAAKYAKWLGFARIETGLFSLDQSRFRGGGTAPRTGFFYAGRISPEKRLDLIARAYARYRDRGGGWTFETFGGSNFLQPSALAQKFRERGCLLLASAFDPWPLVVLEAKSAGCAVICSDRCGNADELGAVKFPYGDVEAMADEMLRIERARETASVDISRYDAPAWASRTLALAQSVLNPAAANQP